MQRDPAVAHARDHPDDKPGGKLMTANFNLGGSPAAPELVDPTWGLSGQPQRPVVAEMEEVIEGIIELGEEVLISYGTPTGMRST